MNTATSVHEFSCEALEGGVVDLADYRGKVLLIVNTASKCGLTPQYEGLEALHQQFADQGLVVLGFPCNQFAGQEPGGADEISSFCQRNYGVSFPMFGKIDVNGKNADPLFQYLSEAAPGILGSKKIKWNFTKFLVDQQGRVIKRYAPKTAPAAIASDIQGLINS